MNNFKVWKIFHIFFLFFSFFFIFSLSSFSPSPSSPYSLSPSRTARQQRAPTNSNRGSAPMPPLQPPPSMAPPLAAPPLLGHAPLPLLSFPFSFPSPMSSHELPWSFKSGHSRLPWEASHKLVFLCGMTKTDVYDLPLAILILNFIRNEL
jgi:hypothetical protein